MQIGYKVNECNHKDCPYRTEPITNADSIRNMSDEELATWIVSMTTVCECCAKINECESPECFNKCLHGVEDWLQQPPKRKVLTMTEYIKREAISEEIRKYYYKNPPNSSYGEGFDRGLDRAQRAILDAPAADVAPVVHGHWIDNGANGYKWAFICSRCGYVDGHPFDDRHNFCPSCGARMDKGE